MLKVRNKIVGITKYVSLNNGWGLLWDNAIEKTISGNTMIGASVCTGIKNQTFMDAKKAIIIAK